MDEEGHTSVVLHADLDCFYAAVEQVRLGIPSDQPLAVQQWEGLIAVNYAARAAGVVRFDRISEAVRKCPELRLVHVETIGKDKAAVGTSESPARYGTVKASLERYRQASANVFDIFHRYSKVCERASIDEAYLDVSDQVEEMLEKPMDWEGELQRLLEPAGSEKKVPVMAIEGGSLAVYNAYDRRLLAGAIIADRMRASIRNELGYTISVGIASNKLLAKIASAKNKPDRQTLIPPSSIPGLMQDLPLKKIKLLGGKLGEEMKSRWGCTTAGEAQQIPQSALVACFGDRLGSYVWKAVQGLKAERVQVKGLVKSMLASKSFGATSDLSDIRRWLLVLAPELAIRIRRDFERNQRQPKLFQLYYRSGKYRNSADHSRSTAMPVAALQILSSSAYSDTDRALDMERGENKPETEAGGEEFEGHGDLSELREDTTAFDGSVQDALTERTRALSKGAKSIQHFFMSHKSTPQHAEPIARQNISIPPAAPVSPPPENSKGILKYLGSYSASATTVAHEGQELLPSTTVSPSVSSPSPKSKGILKYLGSTSPSPTTVDKERQEFVTPDLSSVFPTKKSSELHTDKDESMCNSFVDGVVNLEAVDVEEQRHILEGIYRSKHNQSAGSSWQSTKRARKPGHRAGGSSKRAREEPKQPGIGSYFQARDKT